MMMSMLEHDYAVLLQTVLQDGETRKTRNAITKSIFGASLVADLADNYMPIMQGRKIFTRGVKGEFAALVRRPTQISDFTDWGCNYWHKWAKPDGSINVDYGNAWFDFNGKDQIAELRDTLANNPTDRRMIVSGWRPNALDDLDLPCCHCFYQFYVREGNKLDMIWYQRSVDLMVGLPSDFVLAATWLISLAHEVGLTPGRIKFDLGDCHIYESHLIQCEEYINNVTNGFDVLPTFRYLAKPGKPFDEFEPSDLVFNVFPTYPSMKLELHA